MPPTLALGGLDESLLRLRALGLEDSARAAGGPPSRRDEVTPRQVHFEDEDPEDPQQQIQMLRRALRAEEIRRTQLEEQIRGRGDRRESRMSGVSLVSDFSASGGSHSRAKLEKPKTFTGEYSELYSILNWLHTVMVYLRQCHVEEGDYPSYV